MSTSRHVVSSDGLTPEQAKEALKQTLKGYFSVPYTNNAVKQLLEQIEQKK